MSWMTEWSGSTFQITGKDTAENTFDNEVCLKSSDKDIHDMDCNKSDECCVSTDHAEDQATTTTTTQAMKSTFVVKQNNHKRIGPGKRELFRTDSNITLDSDLSSDVVGSPTHGHSWRLDSTSCVVKTECMSAERPYIMNQQLIEVEATSLSTRRSGVVNYTSGLTDIKETPSFHSNIAVTPTSASPMSPLSLIGRGASVCSGEKIPDERHAKLKRTMSLRDNSVTYAVRRKAMTKSIQEWVNSIDRDCCPNEDDNEALSFLPVNLPSKHPKKHSPEALGTTVALGVTGHGLDSDNSHPVDSNENHIQGQTTQASHGDKSDHQITIRSLEKELPLKEVKRVSDATSVQYLRMRGARRVSNSELIMMATQYREDHQQAPITRRQRLLCMGASQSSELSANSSRSQSSLEELLTNRDNPEEILLDLGFGSHDQDLTERIPTRFYIKPSKARGMNIGQFLNNCHAQEIRSYDDLNMDGGFRSIVGILQRSREGQARELKMSQRIRKKSVVNACNIWLNKTVKGISGERGTNAKERKEQGIEIVEQQCVESDDRQKNQSILDDGEELITTSSVEVLMQENESGHELVVKEKAVDQEGNTGACIEREPVLDDNSLRQDQESSEQDLLEEPRKLKVRPRWILPLPPVTEESDGYACSKKSSSSTLEGESPCIALNRRTGARDSGSYQPNNSVEEVIKHHPLVLDHRVDNPNEAYPVNVKDPLKHLSGILLDTPQESFEFEEVSITSEIIEDERHGHDKQSAMKGQLSRAGSAQSDSSGFADDVVDSSLTSIVPHLSDNDFVYVHDKLIQTNVDQCLNVNNVENLADSLDSLENDSPFTYNCHEVTPKKRTRFKTYPRPSEKIPWSENHPKTVIEILTTLKQSSMLDSTAKSSGPAGRPKRPPRLKLKSVCLDYPDELPFTVPSNDLSFQKSNISVDNARQNNDEFAKNLSFPSNISESLPISDLNVTISSAITTENEANGNTVQNGLNDANGLLHLDKDNSTDRITSAIEVYLMKDHRGFSSVPIEESGNVNDSREFFTSEEKHSEAHNKLSDFVSSMKPCDVQFPIVLPSAESNPRQQMALEDILLLHRAISSYKFELVELETLSDKIYQMVQIHLTLNERLELDSIRTLRIRIMDEVESMERLLVRLAYTIESNHEDGDSSVTYECALDHLQVLKQMILLLQEQKTLRNMLTNLELEYRIAYERVTDEHPMLWSAERTHLIGQLIELKMELDRQRLASHKQFASSLQELKHDLLEKLRNDVVEETENLRSQLKLKVAEVESLKRQCLTKCDDNSNQSNVGSQLI